MSASDGCPCATSSCAVAPGPSSRAAIRSPALPEQYASACPRPVPAPTQGVRSSSTTSTSASTSAACDEIGVATSSVRSPPPDASTTPARIFVPPRSTPITRLSLNPARYPTSPDAAGREALPRLQGRTRQGQGADGRFGSEAPAARSESDRREEPPSEAAGPSPTDHDAPHLAAGDPP